MMMKTKTVVILFIFLSVSTCARQRDLPAAPVVQERGKLKLIIPEDDWEPLFYEEIKERAEIAKLRNLRAIVLPNDDLEVRVWMGFGLSALESFVVRRDTGQWSAMHLDGVHPDRPQKNPQKDLRAPKSGWEIFWKRVVEAGILILPDSSELKGEKLVMDGFGYVVEINMNRTYRTYIYLNPDWQEWPEAKQMIRISNLIAEEFGLQEFQVKETQR